MVRLLLTLALAIPAAAQVVPGLQTPPSGNNQKASVTQNIGPVRIDIEYSSPAVRWYVFAIAFFNSGIPLATV